MKKKNHLEEMADHFESCKTPEQIEALEAFRVKYSVRSRLNLHGVANWKEALFQAWYQGWDDREPGGHHLRYIRNHAGPRWLEAYQPKEATQ